MCLRLDNISKKFGEKSILENFSYSFEKTGLYFISGESGIGKTTLLRIIAGLDTEYSGNLENGGLDNVSFMFQEYRLFPTLNALNNAAISQKNTTKEAYKMLQRLGFSAEDIKKKPHHLSGGMKQRVSFVRAVLMNSAILLLDEPTKELDIDTAKIMIDIIKEESAKRLVIAVTHDDILLKKQNKGIIHL